MYHCTTGKRYKRITISTDPIEKKVTTTKQKTAQLLQILTASNVPHSTNVANVLASEKDSGKPRGRPRKNNKNVEHQSSQNGYNLRCKK